MLCGSKLHMCFVYWVSIFMCRSVTRIDECKQNSKVSTHLTLCGRNASILERDAQHNTM